MHLSKRQQYDYLRSQLTMERSSFLGHWRELADFILPRRSRFTITDVNKGDRRNRNIIDSTPTLAARTLRSGMMSGITSPARPWFRLTTPDQGLSDYGPVKEWLHTVTQRMSTTFLRSNLYNVLPTVYGDLGVFGTAPMLVQEVMTNDVIHCQSFPVGSYMVAKDSRNRVNVFFREFRMTVRQVVEDFANDGGDWSNISSHVKTAYERGDYETWVDICHVIQPNPDHDPNMSAAKFKKFSSCYYEASVGQGSESDKFLRESGYDLFPVLVPRWEVTGEDVYGTDCPGMAALGDVKQLQLGEKRAAEAIEKMIRPPMIAPSSLRSMKASILPGDITYIDERDGQKGFRTAHEVNISLVELENKQQQIRNRVQRAFFEDLFLMLAQSDRRQITAREIDERHEEKLLALGPVLEQLNQDLLDPLVDLTFDIMLRQGQIPPPPEEIQGMDLKVEYISIMAQAQKLIGLGGIERFAGFVGQIVQTTGNPEILDKIDADQLIDVYGDLTSIPPGIVRSDEAVAAMRADRQQAAAQQQQMAAIEQGASAAKNLSQSDMSGDNALTRLLQGGAV